MKKKGQMQMMETFMVLIVIMIMVGFGLYFFLGAMYGGVKDAASEICEKHNEERIFSIVNMPELQCSSRGVTTGNCIDIIKLQSFIDDEGLLDDRFSGGCKMIVKVEQIYPEPDVEETECSGYNIQSGKYDECTYWELYRPKNVVNEMGSLLSMPVTLYYPTMLEYRVGRVTLRILSQ